jgi:hypothetical protein
MWAFLPVAAVEVQQLRLATAILRVELAAMDWL